EKFTEKYKIVSGEAKGKGEELEEFFDLEFIIFQPISEEYTRNYQWR
ncbi:19838_t:CDS:1, partial [Entrophospora sp. SA101]